MSTLTSMSKPLNLPILYSKATPWERRKAREQYVKLQNNTCYFCKSNINKPNLEMMKKFPINKELFPKNMFDYPIHLHHDHNTDLTIGAVHSYCNAILWQYFKE